MFIREIKKKNNNSDKIFRYCRLVESVRTSAGPRQHVVLDLGKLDLPKKQWKELADRIEQIASGQLPLFPVSEDIESLAQHYARLLIKKKLTTSGRHVTPEKRHSEEIYTNDISSHDTRRLGPEHVGLSALKALKLDRYLKELWGIARKRADLAISQIIGRLVHPCSERYTSEQSALDELLGADFSHMPLNSLYRASDTLFSHKDGIENFLSQSAKIFF